MQQLAPLSNACLAAFAAFAAFACSASDDPASEPDASVNPGPPAASEDWTRDILATSLVVDLASMQATATISLAGSTTSSGASFEIGTLEITSVSNRDGALRFRAEAQQLDVGVPPSAADAELEIAYRYAEAPAFQGVFGGLTLTWPYYCGNVFPCKSDPADGVRFSLELVNVPAGEVAVYPASIPGDAPAYMLAWAVDEYRYLDLGVTAAGTQVGAWYRPGEEERTSAGTAKLRAAFEWLELSYGAYSFGASVGPVSAPWGGGAYGGMEHHPLWHTASAAMGDELTQIHEAAHGWFGNGVRIRCWEDFVLSEGLATYLAARAVEAVGGEPVWPEYEAALPALERLVAWPDSCGEVNVLTDNLFTRAPYIKGALFLRAVEQRVGTDALDAVLAAFYAQRVGDAARFQDLLDLIAIDTGWPPDACADAWLRQPTLPAPGACD